VALYSYAIVVGASSGIGAEVAELLAAQGCKVAAIARRSERLAEMAAKWPGKIMPFTHDVTNWAETPALFQEVTRQLGGLDLIVYAAGVMPEVAFTEFDFDKDRLMVEVNLLGAMAWLNEAANRMQQTKHGCIVGIGSRGGDRGFGSMPAYSATKAGLATYLESLRNRVARYGVRVVTVKPGPVETQMTANLHLKAMLPARVAAQRILKLSGRTGEHYLKLSDRVICRFIRAFPSVLFRRLKL
jgi:NADP-dependent 3-hydroxy acid dehydrogenase YdfG